jgi:uncharacterized lipoprotein
MARLIVISISAALALLAGCSHDNELKCDDATRYATSVSIPPIRVPDDLTVPDETDSLLVPDPNVSAEPLPPTQCLETPPSYYEQDDQGE